MQKKENQKEPVQAEKPKTKRKKQGKIAEVYALHQKGVSVKEIAKKKKLSEQVVRSYIWRAKNPEKYKALLKRYFEKKKTKGSSKQTEEKTIKKEA